MAPLSGIQGVSSGNVTETTASKSRTTLDKYAFLKLLVYQLRYQNPLEPLGDQELALQLAQFSTVEGIQNLNKSMVALLLVQAGNLVGKTVTLKDGTSGVVSGVVLRDETVYVLLGDSPYPMTDLVGVEGA
uniref:Basal-body rod modification protein FlgD n=1 Tax=Candidatus Caldatribacterium saccharofermentans TaxID=1454753 RepID=A0A7V4WKP4_9BACT